MGSKSSKERSAKAAPAVQPQAASIGQAFQQTQQVYEPQFFANELPGNPVGYSFAQYFAPNLYGDQPRSLLAPEFEVIPTQEVFEPRQFFLTNGDRQMSNGSMSDYSISKPHDIIEIEEPVSVPEQLEILPEVPRQASFQVSQHLLSQILHEMPEKVPLEVQASPQTVEAVEDMLPVTQRHAFGPYQLPGLGLREIDYLKNNFLSASGPDRRLDFQAFIALYSRIHPYDKGPEFPSIAANAFRTVDVQQQSRINFKQFVNTILILKQVGRFP
jgi:hypothetical protein